MGILIVPLHLPGDGPGLRQQQAQGPTSWLEAGQGFPAAGSGLARVSLWPLCGNTATQSENDSHSHSTLASW